MCIKRIINLFFSLGKAEWGEEVYTLTDLYTFFNDNVHHIFNLI